MKHKNKKESPTANRWNSATLDTQIGGQIEAGFAITGFYEDLDEPEALEQLGKYTATYIVTRAVKL
jgi:hypothetical protein